MSLNKAARQEVVDIGYEVKKSLEEIARNLDKTHEGVSFLRATGGTTGAIGGVMTIIGLVGIPFSLGASSSLIAVGSACGAFGSITSIGAEATGFFITKGKEEQVEREWQKFLSKFVQLARNLPAADLSTLKGVLGGSSEDWAHLLGNAKKYATGSILVGLVKKCVPIAVDMAGALDDAAMAAARLGGVGRRVATAGKAARNVAVGGRVVKTTANAGRAAKTAAVGGRVIKTTATAGRAAKTAAVGGRVVKATATASRAARATKVAGQLTRPFGLFTILSLGASIYDMIDGAIEFGKKNGSPAAGAIRDVVRQIERVLAALENM